LAKLIVSLMPEHVHYCEPYFGGGSVLFIKPFEGISEVANDLSGRLIGFYRVLSDPAMFDQFYRRIETTPFSKELWEESWELCHDPIVDAAKFFILCRQSRGGMMKDFATLSRNRVRRGRNEQVAAWLTAIEGLPQVHARLRRVVWLCDDALNVIQQQDGPNTLHYCDPPYLHSVRATKNAYQHEMTDQQHVELLETLLACKGKVILSGYPNELYDGMLRNWNCQDFAIDNKTAGSKQKRIMTERVWMNF
jgi:DNA adenine methylase